MKWTMRWISGLIVMCGVTLGMSAQRGCFRSPEAPTEVLMAVGGVGMLYGSPMLGRWLSRLARRRRG